jgi:hypothetical protein
LSTLPSSYTENLLFCEPNRRQDARKNCGFWAGHLGSSERKSSAAPPLHQRTMRINPAPGQWIWRLVSVAQVEGSSLFSTLAERPSLLPLLSFSEGFLPLEILLDGVHKVCDTLPPKVFGSMRG